MEETILELKKMTVYSDKIILKNKHGDIIIHSSEIDGISYVRPTFINYIVGAAVRQFIIFLRPKLYGKDHYCFCIKYKDFIKIQRILKVSYRIS